MSVLTLEQLESEALRLWERSFHGAVVWLSGEIGAGKTTLVQAVARAAGAAGARSPTFALVHEYPSPQGPLMHVDCYRLQVPEEARDLDFPGLLRRARLVLVEWPERAGQYAPAPDLTVRMSHVESPTQRRMEVTP